MLAAQDTMLAAARREAAAVESEHSQEQFAAVQAQLAEARRRCTALEQQLKVWPALRMQWACGT